MSFLFQPWHILLAALCGMVNERQQQIIQFQNAQIEVLLKKPGKKRLLLDDDKRRLPVVKGHGIQTVETAAGRLKRLRDG